ncbi:MAG: magnesium and cobalt transport protein CorA [Phenylobacterium sp.]|uniref:magnesium and cobalt transport protein CorA n=1 Tax=Phenylobacterium sp. TaxID=1871053 RepID=UPI0012000949|nr:magnesium and cobalt transport protein CorA [Phenylobacterium sp.]TAL38118.1 MAG: magnesium and cobalt transport protein CorA [Phenylobacterium sp.]
MPIAAARVYSEGHRLRHLRVHDADDRPVQAHQFAWIGLVDPEPAELGPLQAKFGLHPLAVEDALCEHPLPKVSVYGDQIFVAARTARLEGETIVYGETCAFLCKNTIITIRRGGAHAYTEVRRHLEDAPSLLSHGVAYVLYALLDFIVDTYQPIVDEIEEEVLAIERRCLDAFLSRDDVTHLFNLRQELTRFRRMLGPMEEVCAKLEHLHLPFMNAAIRPYFRDVGDHVRRVSSAIEGLREVLSSVFEVANLFEQQRQNDVSRRLTAGAAILAVPTMIFGLYGMNFDVMPELRWQYGYLVVVAVVVVICVGLYLAFRRAKWL